MIFQTGIYHTFVAKNGYLSYQYCIRSSAVSGKNVHMKPQGYPLHKIITCIWQLNNSLETVIFL